MGKFFAVINVTLSIGYATMTEVGPKFFGRICGEGLQGRFECLYLCCPKREISTPKCLANRDSRKGEKCSLTGWTEQRAREPEGDRDMMFLGK
jgi:hypothetical protein